MSNYIRVYLVGSFNRSDHNLIECLREMKENHKITCEKYNIFNISLYAHQFLLQCIEGKIEKVISAINFFVKNHPFCSFKIIFSKILFIPILKENSFCYAPKEILEFFQTRKIRKFYLPLLTHKDLCQLFPLLNKIGKIESRQDLFWYMF